MRYGLYRDSKVEIYSNNIKITSQLPVEVKKNYVRQFKNINVRNVHLFSISTLVMEETQLQYVPN